MTLASPHADCSAMTGFWHLFSRYRSGRRFWRHVVVDGPAACWPWTGATDRQGRPSFHGGCARRRAYELARGSVPPGARVCPRCGSIDCVNPDHLVLLG